MKLSDNFYNWTDGTTTYGVNFAQVDDASSFAQAIVNSIAALSGGRRRKRRRRKKEKKRRK